MKAPPRGLALVAFALLASSRSAHGETRETGFFLRLGIGTSVLFHHAAADAHENVVEAGGAAYAATTRLAYDSHPAGFIGEGAIGGSPWRGVAIGAWYVDHPFLNASYGTVTGDVRGVNARGSADVRMSLFGVLVVVHPNPDGSFYWAGGAGVTTMRWDNPFAEKADPTRSFGFGAAGEVGFEGYAGEKFWIGGGVRLLGGATWKSVDAERHRFFVPTIVVTVGSVGAL